MIAREIHDQIGQALTSLKLDVGWLRNQLPRDVARGVDERARGMDALIDQTIETARRVSAMLRPAILDDLGLAAAIRWQTPRLRAAHRRPLRARSAGGRPASRRDRAQHVSHRPGSPDERRPARPGPQRAHRPHASIPESAVLTLADDGRGVTAEELERPTSLGIVGIRERALAVGGEVTITGSAERGTTLTVRVPMTGEQALAR